VSAGAHRIIIIVGGGAGGLELATRLGDTLGRAGEDFSPEARECVRA
jgi:NADH:ubiquinone reductase (H+-translocating)